MEPSRLARNKKPLIKDKILGLAGAQGTRNHKKVMQGVHNQKSYTEPRRLARNKETLTRSTGSALSRLVYWAQQAGKEQETTEKVCKECIFKDHILGHSRLAKNKKPLKRSAGSALSKIVYWAPAGWQGTKNH